MSLEVDNELLERVMTEADSKTLEATTEKVEAEVTQSTDAAVQSRLEAEEDEFFGRMAWAIDRSNNFPG